MRKACFANARKGAYLAYVTAASVKQSSLYRYKPNPLDSPPPPVKIHIYLLLSI